MEGNVLFSSPFAWRHLTCLIATCARGCCSDITELSISAESSRPCSYSHKPLQVLFTPSGFGDHFYQSIHPSTIVKWGSVRQDQIFLFLMKQEKIKKAAIHQALLDKGKHQATKLFWLHSILYIHTQVISISKFIVICLLATMWDIFLPVGQKQKKTHSMFFVYRCLGASVSLIIPSDDDSNHESARLCLLLSNTWVSPDLILPVHSSLFSHFPWAQSQATGRLQMLIWTPCPYTTKGRGQDEHTDSQLSRSQGCAREGLLYVGLCLQQNKALSGTSTAKMRENQRTFLLPPTTS